MIRAVRSHMRIVETINRFVGRFAMYLIFAMVGILLGLSVSKTFSLPSLWALEIEVAVQTGELVGIARSGITEEYAVGRADVTNSFLTNNISGAWAESFFANMDRYNELPPHLQELLKLTMDSSHYYRQWWYWGGESHRRTRGTRRKLTSIPDAEWATVEAATQKFWDEIAAESETKAKVVQILKDYNAAMEIAGRPYRYG